MLKVGKLRAIYTRSASVIRLVLRAVIALITIAASILFAVNFKILFILSNL